jgi:hypothetical protein
LKKVTDVFVLHEVESHRVANDVRLFFKHSFLEMAGGLEGWPRDEDVERLCHRAAGLFVYAVATIQSTHKRGTSPRSQLDLLLRSPDSSVREAKMKFKTNTSLDSLYTSILPILQEAFGDDNDEDEDINIRSVLGAMIVAANPLSPSSIDTLMNFNVGDAFPGFP